MKKQTAKNRKQKTSKRTSKLSALLQYRKTSVLVALLFISIFSGIGAYYLNQGHAASEVSRIRIGSYNVLASYRQDIVDKMGSNYSVKERSVRAASVIKGKAGTKSFDVVGVQEMTKTQFGYMTDELPGYSHFPSTFEGTRETTRYSQRTIFWKTNRFSLVDSGSFAYTGYYDSNYQLGFRSPWVELKDKDNGRTFYVLNVHPVANIRSDWYPNNNTDGGGALKREHTAERIAAWVAGKQSDEKTIFVIGDMNSRFNLLAKDAALNGNRNRLPYCIITASQIMQHAADAARGNEWGVCPTTSNEGSVVDQIYLRTKKATAIRFVVMPWGTTYVKGTSDHRPVYADVDIYPSVAAKNAAAAAKPVVDETEPQGYVNTDKEVLPDCGDTTDYFCE